MAGYIGSKASVVSSGAERKKTFTITGATTSLTGLNYTVGKVHVFQNGVRLVDGTDYTATNGTTITLTVAAQSGDNVVVISQADFQVSGAVSTSGDTMTGDLTVQGAFTSQGIDDNGNATAITIDSNEKVLIGKTSAGYNVDGFEAHPNGETYVSRSGTPMAINRNSSDGTLLNLYKDGAGVGSIGSNIGHMYLGTDDVGLRFSHTGDYIYPVTTNGGTGRDNAIGLGYAGSRFKDLYLSGGVYLGGTVAANKLDDYEEGTWTPTITNSGFTNSASSLTATYTKVGNTVHFELHIVFATSTTVSSHVYISGFPFVSAGSGDAFSRQACGIYNCDDPASGAGYDVGFIRAGQVSGQITLYKGINPASDTQWLARGSIRVT